MKIFDALFPKTSSSFSEHEIRHYKISSQIIDLIQGLSIYEIEEILAGVMRWVKMRSTFREINSYSSNDNINQSGKPD